MINVKVEVSARHAHLTQFDLDAIFGEEPPSDENHTSGNEKGFSSVRPLP